MRLNSTFLNSNLILAVNAQSCIIHKFANHFISDFVSLWFYIHKKQKYLVYPGCTPMSIGKIFTLPFLFNFVNHICLSQWTQSYLRKPPYTTWLIGIDIYGSHCDVSFKESFQTYYIVSVQLDHVTLKTTWYFFHKDTTDMVLWQPETTLLYLCIFVYVRLFFLGTCRFDNTPDKVLFHCLFRWISTLKWGNL